jgi:iron complex outermembrane receptor protein
MKNVKLSQAVKLAILAAGGTGLALPVVAQEGELEEITVTGSRIVRTDLESVSPLAAIGAEEFVISGNLNIEQKLNELPMTVPNLGPSSNNPGDGTARIDLRGLGTSRTLVLVNGRRYIPSTQFGVVDLNTVPGTLIERVDVVTGGASAVYGSDALAGVVNFVMMDDFEGVQLTALYDTTTEGDAAKWNTDITVGGNFADGRGNAVLYASYSKRDPLFQGDREFSSLALRDNEPVGTPGQNPSTGVGGPLVAGGSSGIPGTRDFTGLTVNPGLPNEYVLGVYNSDGTGGEWDNVASRFNFAPDNYLQLPQERYVMSAFAHFDVNDKVTAYTELQFANNFVPQELAPTPAFLYYVDINPDSPFFAPEIQNAWDGERYDSNGDGVIDNTDNASLFLMGRRMVENGPRQAEDTRNAWRVLVGAKGDFTDDWGWDAYYSQTSMKNDQFLNNDVSDTRFRQAVLVSDDGLSCQDPSGGCVPMNIFGAGNITQEAVGFVNIGATNVTTINQQIVNATVNGQFGGIGDAGPIDIAVGTEHRADDSSFRPDTFLSSGDVLGFNAGQQTVGGFSVTEYFGEINVPLLADRTMFESLSIWGAVRSSDYSNIGNVTSYAAALNWAPIEQVRFRGGYQRAVRAPNVGELFQGAANGFPGATDPCSSSGSAVGTGPGDPVYDICVAHGVSGATVGVFDQANTQIEGTFGGNPNLSEEESDTTTLGIVVQPIDSLDFTVDYFDIEVTNAINVLGGGLNNTLDICYNVVQDTSSEYCQAVRRSGDQVRIVSVLNANISTLATSGVDLGVNWANDFNFGIGDGSTFTVNMMATFLDSADTLPDANLTVNKCKNSWGNTCGRPRTDTLVNTRIGWQTGNLTVSMLWKHIGETESDLITLGGSDPTTLSVPYLDSQNYVDLTFAYEFTDSFRVNVGIKNLLDESPTFIGSEQEQANSFPETYDVIGPRTFISANYTWD